MQLHISFMSKRFFNHLIFNKDPKVKSVLSNLFVKLICGCIILGGFYGCQEKKEYNVIEDNNSIIVETENYNLTILKEGFRYGFQTPSGKEIASPHKVSGIQIAEEGKGLSDIQSSKLLSQETGKLGFEIRTESGTVALLDLWIESHSIKIQVSPDKEGEYTIIGRTNGIAPAYGLGDQGSFGGGSWESGVRSKVELTGVDIDSVGGDHRMVSNFAIFPQQGFGTVNIEPGEKVVRLMEDENVQGSKGVNTMEALYYFVGSPKQIYETFLDVRNREGYPVYKPKYEWFGVGWEAFGALAWNTNQETVTENVNKYLELGFPLEWMVVGSGFWPRAEGEMDEHGTPYNAETDSEKAKSLLATTSFGMWDDQMYPDPEGMIEGFHNKGLKFTIGLRIGFIPGGPFTEEGLENRYFIEDKEGNSQLFSVGFPEPEVYLLDAHKPEAVDWYVELSHKWMDYGVDGFKEDLFGYPESLRDDFLNPINEALMDDGAYIMGRNNYLGSPVDIHRYNDFNYNQPQDRGPINGLAYAYSGFPYVYPDIVGGTGLATGRFGDEPKDQLRIYLMRYAEYAALNPSMSFGYGPWNFDEEVTDITRDAAELHDRLQPFIYSNAIKAYKTGFPYTLTPLPLAYPNDKNVYELADTTRRSYQWLIGESLLATPLYGDDYAEANSRDVYLPEGIWIEYDSGEVHEGPVTLEDYPLPIGKTPLFVGGNGIVIEEINEEIKGRIYPVAEQAEMDFVDKDGKTSSTITISEPNWENPEITDKTTGEEVSGIWKRHAFEFVLVPGHDYIIE